MRLISLYLKAIIARIKRIRRKNKRSHFTSDLHFGHANVILYCDRPFKNTKQMDKFLIFQWNCYVAPQDEVYVLGDFALNRNALSVIGPKLNGKKFLISGNHDKTFLKRDSKNKHAAADTKKAVDAGWVVTQQIEVETMGGLKIIMTHLPPKKEGMTQYDERYMNERIDPDEKALHLHGHLHGKYRKRGNLIDVGWDAWQRPITMKEVIDVFHDDELYIASPLENFNKKRQQSEQAT